VFILHPSFTSRPTIRRFVHGIDNLLAPDAIYTAFFEQWRRSPYSRADDWHSNNLYTGLWGQARPISGCLRANRASEANKSLPLVLRLLIIRRCAYQSIGNDSISRTRQSNQGISGFFAAKGDNLLRLPAPKVCSAAAVDRLHGKRTDFDRELAVQGMVI